jgi:hypothetical protein
MSDSMLEAKLLEAKRISRGCVKQGIKLFLFILGMLLSVVMLGVFIGTVEWETPICFYHLLMIAPFPFMCWVQEVQGKEWEKFKKDSGLDRR